MAIFVIRISVRSIGRSSGLPPNFVFLFKCCTNLLDEVIVAGRDVQEHNSRVKAVLSRLVKCGATTTAEECDLGKLAVDFDAHRLSAESIRPLHSNV